jgi:hypothetical protein
MPPLNTGNHEIEEVSFRVDNKHGTSLSRKDADIRNELCRLQELCEDMKFQIEFLEDGRQKMALKYMFQASTIETLKKDSELKDVKMGILEELFRSLNNEERSSCQAQETTAAVTTTKPVPKKTKSESRLTTSKKNKIISAFCRRNRLEKMNSVPVLTTSEKAEVLSSLKGTCILDPNYARRMEIKIGDLEGHYNGPLRNSLPRGTGTIRFRNGDTYVGELFDGEMHGNGTLYHRSKDSGTSRGCFAHNVFVGVEKEGPRRKRR